MTRELEELKKYNEAKFLEIEDDATKEKARILMDKYPDKILDIVKIPDYVDIDLLIEHLAKSRYKDSFYIGRIIYNYFKIICTKRC